jgi:hypothetical protein
MKKFNIRLIAISFLILVSIISYSYLVGVASSSQTPANSIYTPVEEEASENEIYLPDVEMVNKLIEAGKRLSALGS